MCDRQGWRLAIGLLYACVLLFGRVGAADSQGAQSCAYQNGIPTLAVCRQNSTPAPIITGLGGNQIVRASCLGVLTYAIASLYSYDSLGCHAPNTTLPAAGHHLKYLGDEAAYLPPNWRRLLTRDSNARGGLYCDTDSNLLILAFTGSLSPSLRSAAVDDWSANVLEHLGERPLQYQFAEDVADVVQQRWTLGSFDKACGKRRPKFVLTGHSKGGGQATYAAEKIKLGGVVFNSDIVNPVIADDELLKPDASRSERLALSLAACRGLFSKRAISYINYLSSGAIKDIRMTNDPLTRFLFSRCGDNLPHADIEWLSDSSTCSSDGHAMETVFRELTSCAK
jgi:hypothetical protein